MIKNPLDFSQIRRTATTALFSDDALTDCLVLKGGNALDLIYGITSRASIDLDFSMGQDFQNFPEARNRFFSALRDRFDSYGHRVVRREILSKTGARGLRCETMEGRIAFDHAVWPTSII